MIIFLLFVIALLLWVQILDKHYEDNNKDNE
jgi:hypothetical protein